MTKVLYIEHDDDNLYMLKMRLERADDFEVIVSDNTEQGCKLAVTEHEPIPGKEEYLNSEKYELKTRNWDQRGNIKEYIGRLNRIRRENPALLQTGNLRFTQVDDAAVIGYVKKVLEPRIAQGPKPSTRGRPDPVGVAAEFLRKELAKGPVLVSELEATARAAGLLGSGQRITHAKPFKRAKKSLGIRSVRNGFGSAGEWFWLLERQPAPLVAEPPPEVAPRIPSGWIDGVARLGQRRPPPDIPPHRWRQFLTDCTKFLASPGEWAERAAALGWDAVALFGCCRHRPLDRPRSAGLLWALNSGRLVELHRDWTVVELAENFSHKRRQSIIAAFRPAKRDRQILTFDKSRPADALTKGGHKRPQIPLARDC